MSIDGFAIGRCSIRQGEESSDAAIPRGARFPARHIMVRRRGNRP
jgi:hypothetical protein